MTTITRPAWTSIGAICVAACSMVFGACSHTQAPPASSASANDATGSASAPGGVADRGALLPHFARPATETAMESGPAQPTPNDPLPPPKQAIDGLTLPIGVAVGGGPRAETSPRAALRSRSPDPKIEAVQEAPRAPLSTPQP